MTLEEYEANHPSCGLAVWLCETYPGALDMLREDSANGTDPIQALTATAERIGLQPDCANWSKRAITEFQSPEFRHYLAARLGMV